MSCRLILLQFRRWTTIGCVAFGLASLPQDAPAQQDSADATYRRFDEISALRADGEFDRAIAMLHLIIEEYADSEDVLPRAFNELVFTMLSKRSIASDEEARRALDAEARANAEAALRRFPDLVADRHFFPAEINTIYDGLRETMFGEIHIVTSPSGCRVLVGDAYEGTSPVSIPYFPVGTYQLLMSHSGYEDRLDSLEVIPGGVVQREISLSKRRGRGWWLARIVPSLAACALIAAAATGGSDEDAPTNELPGPPPPPAR